MSADLQAVQRGIEAAVDDWWNDWPDLADTATHPAGAVFKGSIVDASTGQPGVGLFRVVSANPGIAPTTDDGVPGEWSFITWQLPVVYENTLGNEAVLGMIGTGGAVRLQVSWGSSKNRTLSGRSGRVRELEGTLTSWVYTPVNQGTRKGLQAATWLRQFFLSRDKGWIDSCGADFSLRNPDGPRSVSPAGGTDFYTHVLTCSISLLETVGGF